MLHADVHKMMKSTKDELKIGCDGQCLKYISSSSHKVSNILLDNSAESRFIMSAPYTPNTTDIISLFPELPHNNQIQFQWKLLNHSNTASLKSSLIRSVNYDRIITCSAGTIVTNLTHSTQFQRRQLIP